MKTSDECKAFIMEQVKFHDSRAQEFAATPGRANRHISTSIEFKEVVAGIVKLEQEINSLNNKINDIETSKAKKSGQLTLSLTPDDLDGLPDDLISELSISGANKSEYSIMKLLEDFGGIMSLDQIIVGLYRMTKEINKRVAVTNRLYRMTTKGLVFSVPNKKGVYSLKRLTENDTKKMFDNSRVDRDEGGD